MRFFARRRTHPLSNESQSNVSKWRRESAELRKALSRASGAGGQSSPKKFADTPTSVAEEGGNDGLVQCPHCERRFNEKVSCSCYIFCSSKSPLALIFLNHIKLGPRLRRGIFQSATTLRASPRRFDEARATLRIRRPRLVTMAGKRRIPRHKRVESL